jgi:hypothetical protein
MRLGAADTGRIVLDTEALRSPLTNSRASGVLDDDGSRKSPPNRVNEGAKHSGATLAPEIEHRLDQASLRNVAPPRSAGISLRLISTSGTSPSLNSAGSGPPASPQAQRTTQKSWTGGSHSVPSLTLSAPKLQDSRRVGPSRRASVATSPLGDVTEKGGAFMSLSRSSPTQVGVGTLSPSVNVRS